MEKFLFFKWKKEYLINILIIIEIMLWILMVGQLINIISFDNNYKYRFIDSFPVETGVYVNKFDSRPDEKIIQKLESEYKDKYLISQSRTVANNDINIKSELKRNPIKQGFEEFNGFYITQMNFNYIKQLNKNLDNKIDESQWKISDKEIPIIVGKNFEKLYKVGDIIEESNGKFYKIIGILNKSLLFNDMDGDAVSQSISLDDSIVQPINKINLEDYYVLIINGSDINESRSIYDEIKEIDNDLIGKNMQSQLDSFLESINSLKMINFTQSLAITMIAIFIITLTINYKIEENKEQIGIIMVCGGSSLYIMKKLFKEMLVLIIIGTTLSIPISFKLTELSIIFFYSVNQQGVILISLIITLLIIILVLMWNVKKINKLTLRELIGGVRE